MARLRLSSEESEGLAVPDSVDGFALGTYWWIAYAAAALVLLLFIALFKDRKVDERAVPPEPTAEVPAELP